MLCEADIDSAVVRQCVNQHVCVCFHKKLKNRWSEIDVVGIHIVV